jgi:hypothetical protein
MQVLRSNHSNNSRPCQAGRQPAGSSIEQEGTEEGNKKEEATHLVHMPLRKHSHKHDKRDPRMNMMMRLLELLIQLKRHCQQDVVIIVGSHHN